MSLAGKFRATLAPYTKLIFLRNAVDFGLPLLNNARTAQLFVESLAKKIPQGGLRSYTRAISLRKFAHGGNSLGTEHRRKINYQPS